MKFFKNRSKSTIAWLTLANLLLACDSDGGIDEPSLGEANAPDPTATANLSPGANQSTAQDLSFNTPDVVPVDIDTTELTDNKPADSIPRATGPDAFVDQSESQPDNIPTNKRTTLHRGHLTYLGAFTVSSTTDTWRYSADAMGIVGPVTKDGQVLLAMSTNSARDQTQRWGIGKIVVPPDSRLTKPDQNPGVVNLFEAEQYDAVEYSVGSEIGVFESQCPDGSNCNVRIGDVEYFPDLDAGSYVFSWQDTYNVKFRNDYKAHGVLNAGFDLEGSLWHVGPQSDCGEIKNNKRVHCDDSKLATLDYHNSITNNYIIRAPDGSFLADKNLLVGNHRTSGAHGGAQGPSLIAVGRPTESNIYNGDDLSEPVTLLNYGFDPQCIFNSTACAFSGYNANDQWGDGLWIRTDSIEGVMFFGRKATSDVCYGYPGGHPDPNVRPEDETAEFYGFQNNIGFRNCVAYPTTPENLCDHGGIQGFHSGPYQPMMLFYSAEALADVWHGNAEASTLQPHSMHPIPASETFIPGGCGELISAAYDAVNGRIYVAEHSDSYGGSDSAALYGRAIVHVYEIEK